MTALGNGSGKDGGWKTFSGLAMQGGIAPERHAAEKRFTLIVILLTLAAGLCGYFLFTRDPLLDLEIARGYWAGARGKFADDGIWSMLRDTIYWSYSAFYIAIMAGLVLSLYDITPLSRMKPRDWSYLVACSLAGPLLLTNLVLQGVVNRPRPRSVIELGGNHAYTPVFEPGGTCDFGCSFVSGEVSSAAMILASLMFVSQRWRPLFAILLIPGSAFIGYLRVRAGGHFVSDAFFAGIFMILIAAALYWLFYLGAQARRSAAQ